MAKPLSLTEIRKRASAFVKDWRDEAGEEKQQAQSYVRDLLAVYGITATKAALYEKRAKKSSTGGLGYIDALVPGLAVVEMKSRGVDLDLAENQALDYLDSLTDIEMPRYIITSDFGSIRVLDLEGEAGKDTEVFGLDELPARARALAFLAGYQERSFGSAKQEAASIRAARIMGDLYESLEDSGYGDHEASVFLVRTLFCLYADDAGVWGERDLFYEFIETRTADDGGDLGGQLSMLYQSLNKTIDKRQTTTDPLVAQFPYVNGDLFAEPVSIPVFDSTMRTKLLEACAFNWSEISPAIFGSLFQAVKDKTARRELGEHYTTETNILKTINPLFMDELRQRFTDTAHNTGGLKKLRTSLGKIRVLDPACGCGNFLIIAYRELRALDLAILKRLQELGDTSEIPTLFFTKADLPVTLDHFAGIEIEEWPARIAATALHLVDHQANQAMELALGTAPDPLPLTKLATIHVANALRFEWGTIFPPSPDVRIVGNPPFVGHKTKQADQVADLQAVWGKDYDGYLDYVTGWFRKSADYFAATVGGRFALVSTNSVAQGLPVASLFGPLFAAGWRIRFAHQTFAWTSEAPGAAAVHCVITGFDRAEKSNPVLYGYRTPKGAPESHPVASINPYLVDGPVQFVAARRKPLATSLPPASYGTMPIDGGNLIVEANNYDAVAADAVAAKYLRKFVGARELVRNEDRWCLWCEDLNPSDLAKSPLLKARIEACRHFRANSKTGGDAYKYRDTPHLFRPNKNRPLVPYLGIPRHVSETRRYFTAQRYDPEVICGDANFTAVDPDGFFFAIISSSMFLAWQAAVGGRIKSDYRFSNTVVWNNLPLPTVNEKNRAEIIKAGQAVLAARELHPDRSLAEQYNPLAMDPALIKAHQSLDRSVDRAFGARKAMATMEDRQSVLFTRYAELAN